MIEGLNDILKADSARSTKMDCVASVEEYINKSDWRISANSNVQYSHAGLINNLAGKAIANFWLDKVYTKKEGDAHRNGDYHIHDLDCLSPYCAGHDLQDLLASGFNGVVSRVSSKPPKHFREALGQMANFIGILQSEWAGAQAFSSFDTLLAPYVFFDMMVEGMDERDVKKSILSFVYNLNVPSRWGQAPFSNVTIDMTVPQYMRHLSPQRGEEPYFVRNWREFLESENLTNDPDEALEKNEGWNRLFEEARKRLNDFESDEETILYSLTYEHFKKEMMIISKMYYEVLSDGDSIGQPFTFPIPTVNITEDFDWDDPEYDFLFENAARYGSSYFQNFIGSQYLRDDEGKLTIRDENAYSPNDVRSMCPLTFDTKVITNKGVVELKDLDPSVHKVRTNMARWAEFRKSPIYNNHTVFRITFENQTFADMSSEHLQCAIKDGNSKLYKASELEVGMKCMFLYDCTVDGSRVMGGNEYAITQIEKMGVAPTQCIEIVTDDEYEHEFMLANGLMTHNCRLQLDRKALRKRGGGLFGSDSRTGSIGVVTINMARLGYLYKGDEKGLYKRLGQLMDMARSTLDKKRTFVEEMYLRGLYPYTRRYVPSYDTFFSTIGVNGMNEMVRNFTNDEYDITDPRGQKMALDILKWMNSRFVEWQETGKALWNLEATPAEGTTYRFAKEDIKRYPDIIQAGFPDAPYYTNSSQLPVDFSDDVFAVLDLQDDLQKAYTGGTVLHIYNDEDVTAEECKVLLRKVLTNYRLPYVSFTATFSTCPKHGRIPGIHEFCPLCDKELMAKHADEIDPNKA